MQRPTELFNQLVNGTTEQADQLIRRNKTRKLPTFKIEPQEKPQQDIMLFVRLVQKN